jgi:hypothetical protein
LAIRVSNNTCYVGEILPKLMSEMMPRMMKGMMDQVGGDDCDPEEM